MRLNSARAPGALGMVTSIGSAGAFGREGMRAERKETYEGRVKQ